MTNALTSVSRILQLVEQAASNRSNAADVRQGSTQDIAQPQGVPHQYSAQAQQSVQFPSLLDGPSDYASNNFIRLSDRNAQSQPYGRAQHHADGSLGTGIATLDPMSSLDFDVLTTDLFNFFPNSLEGANTTTPMNQQEQMNTFP